MQDLFTQVYINDFFLILAGVWILQQILKIFKHFHFFNIFILNFNFRRMGRYMVPLVKDNNSLGTQKTVSMDFDEEFVREGR